MPTRHSLLALFGLALVACDPKSSDEPGEVNTPPEGLAVTLQPDDPTTVDDLVVAVEEATDADGDALSYTVTWTRDGVEVPDYADLDTVPASATQAGEEWAVSVVASDGQDASAPATDQVAIVNSPPVVEGVTLTPDPAFEDTVLTATVTAFDADDEALSVRYVWLVNGEDVPTDDDADTLDGEHFSKGDTVVVEVFVSDEEAASDTVASNEVVIENTPPRAPEVDLIPEKPTPSEALHCRIRSLDDDIDGDDLTVSITWTVEGEVWTGATFDDRYPGDSIDADFTSVGDRWQCTVTVDDGEEAAEAVESPSRFVKETLVLDGGSATLDDTSIVYHDLVLENGSELRVTGTVQIVADSLFVDATSSIIGDGGGHPADTGDGAGGTSSDGGCGGGGHGGEGGGGGSDDDDTPGPGGATVGFADDLDLTLGSGGGTCSDAAGAGGAALLLAARDIDVAGTISVNGGDSDPIAEDGLGRGSGGGSGGGLLLWGDTVSITGGLYALGGDAGACSVEYVDRNDGGGGGGGGRIKVFYGTSLDGGGGDASGGLGAECGSFEFGAHGEDGTVHTDQEAYIF